MQPEMMPCVNSPELTVLERQRTRLLRWHHEQGNAPFQQQTSSFYSSGGGGGGSSLSFSLGNENLMGLGEVVNQCKMAEPSPGIEYWSQLGKMEVPNIVFGGGICAPSSSGYEMSRGSVSRTSCPPTVAVAVEKIGAPVGKDCFKKRKLERARSAKGCEEDTRDKKLKGCSDEMESKITEQSNNKNNANKKESKNSNSINKETSASNSKDSSKASEVQKPDYIHVRARRGQATDSHSLAERVRREKISERMKFLQDLVPGCNKITGKAGMLDEIINYVQYLQRHVKFLSMKLATVNPRLDFDIDSLFSKECAGGFPTINMSSEQTNPSYLHCHPMQQLGSCSGLQIGINDPSIGLQRSATAPVPIPEPFIDSSCLAQMQPPATAWDLDFQNFCNMEFQQATETAYQSHHQYIGPIQATNMKMEI